MPLPQLTLTSSMGRAFLSKNGVLAVPNSALPTLAHLVVVATTLAEAEVERKAVQVVNLAAFPRTQVEATFKAEEVTREVT